MEASADMSIAADHLITADELLQMPDDGIRRELVRGEVIETMPPNYEHGLIALRLGSLLLAWIAQGAGGEAGVETGFRLARNPDTVRGPDVFYIRPERGPQHRAAPGFPDLAPDLAVEIVSPTETAEEVQAKVTDYLTAGARLVWVIYPRQQQVVAHTPDGVGRTFRTTDTLAQPALLPGFACPVAALFPA
ncbi:MAG: Uma2 family endonuclease [Chloroflexaceae bacterium]|nr:Uma2 family endonuclease [Chloroflexaceae bacterium]